MPLRAKRMKGLRIDEASGVDAPAHLSPGWMVLKSAGDPLAGLSDDELEDVIKALEAEQGEPVEELIATLTKALGSMPEPAKATATALIGALGGGAGDGDDPVAKAVAAYVAKAKADADAAEERAKTAEAELAKAKGNAAETEEEALAKAMTSLPEPIRKAWEADRAKVAKAEADAAEAAEVAKSERDARLSGEYLAKANGPDYSGLPISPEGLATALRQIDEGTVTKETGAELHRVLKAAAHIASHPGDFVAFGGVGADATGAGGAMAQLNAAADKLIEADPSLTKAEAITKAADNNPDLARAYQEGNR